MAETDTNAIMNLLENVLGEEKGQEAKSLMQSVLGEKSLPEASSSAQFHNTSSDQLIDTAHMMQQISNLMNRLNQAKNTKEVGLLSAIRPYLRASRQPKVDSCLKILQAYEVFRDMKKTGK